jgi:hypothetical protein
VASRSPNSRSAGRLLPYISETLPTAAEVTSIAPSATPTRTSVRIHRRCRIDARYRIDRIFINHRWRRRYNDRPANHDNGSRLLDNDRWRRPVLVRIAWNFAIGRYSVAIAGEARASALAAPKIALRMDVAPFLIPFFCFFVALWKKTREPVVRFMNACSARKRAGVLYLHPIAAYHLRPGYSSAIYHPHRIEASSVTSVDGTFRK